MDGVTGVRLDGLLDLPPVAAAAAACPGSWPPAPWGLPSPDVHVPLGDVLAGTALGGADGRWWLQLDEELSGIVGEGRDDGPALEEWLTLPPLAAVDVEQEDEHVWTWAARPGDDLALTAAAALTALAGAHRAHVAHHERETAALTGAAAAVAEVLRPYGFRRNSTLFVREPAPGVVQAVQVEAESVGLGVLLPAVEAFLDAPEAGLGAATAHPPPAWPLPSAGSLRYTFPCPPADAAATTARDVLPLLDHLGSVPALLEHPGSWSGARPEILRLVLLVADGRRDEAQRAAATVHAAVRPQARPFVLRVVAGLGLQPPPIGSRPDRTPADDAFLAEWAAGAPQRVARLRALAATTGTRLPPRPGLLANQRLGDWLRQHAATVAAAAPDPPVSAGYGPPREPGALWLAELVTTWIAGGLHSPEWTICGDGGLGLIGGPHRHGLPALDPVHDLIAAGRLDAGRTLRAWRRRAAEAQSGSGRAS